MAFQEYGYGEAPNSSGASSSSSGSGSSSSASAATAATSTPSPPTSAPSTAPSGYYWRAFGALYTTAGVALGPGYALVPNGYASIQAWADAAENKGKSLAAPAAPSGQYLVTVWYTSTGGVAGYIYGGASDVGLPTYGAEVEIAPGGSAQIQAGAYIVRFNLNVGKGGTVLWRMDGDAWIVVPPQYKLNLGNRIKEFEAGFTGLLGQSRVNDANGSIYYKTAGKAPEGVTSETSLKTFNAMLAEASGRLRSQLTNAAQLQGDFRVDEPAHGIWQLQWPTLDAAGLGEFFGLTGPGGFFTGVANWLAKYWWVLVLLAVVVAGLFVIPFFILAFAKLWGLWAAVFALL